MSPNGLPKVMSMSTNVFLFSHFSLVPPPPMMTDIACNIVESYRSFAFADANTDVDKNRLFSSDSEGDGDGDGNV